MPFQKIPLKGWVGLAITIGFLVGMMMALPALRWFFLLSIPPGLLVGLVMYLINRRRRGW